MSVANSLAPNDSRDLSYHSIRRQLARLLPGNLAPHGDGPGAPLEATSTPTELPRLISAVVIEGSTLRSIPVSGVPVVGFSAFLDGTQDSRVLDHSNGFPVILGTVAAVVRVRAAGRLSTWRHLVARRVYAPLALLGPGMKEALQSLPVEVVDTLAQGPADGVPNEHPYAVRDSAIHLVQRHRELLEQELASAWCESRSEPLFVDGGISNASAATGVGEAVGVVKSHRTLYAEGDALRTILHLECGERSSVFLVTSPKRRTVASWYLRLRPWRGHDPMWGLVRVEIDEPAGSVEMLSSRADEVSRWILAEVTPVALPDKRWDRLVYGIRDCEEFLKAIT